MSESTKVQSSAATSVPSPHSSPSQKPTEIPFPPSLPTSMERYYQGISASYEKLTEMYSILEQEKGQEIAGWKR